MPGDLLRFDPPAIERLAIEMGRTVDSLERDRGALQPLLADAGSRLGREVSHPVTTLARAGDGLRDLAQDLHRRLAAVERDAADIATLDALTAEMHRWHRHDPARAALVDERVDVLRRLLGDDLGLVSRATVVLNGGLDAAAMLAVVHAEVAAEAKAVALHDELGLTLDDARQRVAEVERVLSALARAGVDGSDAVGILAVIDNFDITVSDILERAHATGVPAIRVAGELLTAQALGLDPDEYDALTGLETHFAAFDAARGDGVDDRVSIADLVYVAVHPGEFTESQVRAAEAIIASAELRHRLDTADENEDILGSATFGRRSRGDGVIAMADLESFRIKAQLNHVLGDYADRIDAANDPTGRVDGITARADLERFIVDNPELPPAVVAAAETMIAAGWFDESWWQAHKDELAMGAALVVGGAIVVLSGGSAGLLVVAGAGGLAAGATTVGINLATGDDPLDDAADNALSGLFVAAGVHGLATGASAYAVAANRTARAAAVAGMLSGSSEVVAFGGVDLLLPEELEDDARAIAAEVAAPAAAADALSPGPMEMVDVVNLIRGLAVAPTAAE